MSGARLEDDTEAHSSVGLRAGLVLDGRYRLERPLGEGGMGLVWVAEQLALERKVAIKSLRFAGGDLRDRLRREALALASVHHPAIVQVHDYGETADGVPYVVMELVSGESLAAHLARRGPMAAEEAVALALPRLDGLAAAHAAGIIHRDIKPSNVLLGVGPDGITPKLLDFGIAFVERGDYARITRDGGVLGTPVYMAPEQARGEQADARADVWGVATLIYELIAGEPPFLHGNLVEVLRRIVEQPPPYPREARGLNGRLWSILTAALRKSRDERTGSVKELRGALSAWLETRPGAPAAAPPLAGPAAPSRESRAEATTLPAGSPAPNSPRPPAPTPRDAAGSAGGPPSLDALIREKLRGA
ncbi:MAG: serine/threonine-protein kinase [Byssovorax sp.]